MGNEKQVLNDPAAYPSCGVLGGALGGNYPLYEAFTERLPELGVQPEWRYYNDGKSWLFKGIYKKKTVFWLSVWDGYFKVTFYFGEAARAGVQNLPVGGLIKESAAKAAAVGKMYPLVIDVRAETPLDDIFTLIAYKQSIK